MTKKEYLDSVINKCYKNTINKKFGLLKVIDFSHRDNTHTYWICLCDCGNKITATRNSLQRKSTKSCGCYKKQIFIKNITTHKMSNTSQYKVWHAMMQRCYNKSCKAYKNYGMRGILVDKNWHDFITWFNDFGCKKINKNDTIERIDNNKEYSKENCRWASILEQQQNKRTVTSLTYNNETMSIMAWSRRFCIPKNTVYYRLKNGWSFEECFIYKSKSKQP